MEEMLKTLNDMLTAQKESNRQLRQKLGLPEPELSVLTLALAKWEFPAPEFLPAPELELPPPELEVETLELESPAPKKEGLLPATEKGEEVTPQPRPPPLCHSPALVDAVPCPVLPDMFGPPCAGPRDQVGAPPGTIVRLGPYFTPSETPDITAHSADVTGLPPALYQSKEGAVRLQLSDALGLQK
ncbi:UNVERIFIED_CONTAM: hypothetical protein FKN15_054134 [Acipenser sinensis]